MPLDSICWEKKNPQQTFHAFRFESMQMTSYSDAVIMKC